MSAPTENEADPNLTPLLDLVLQLIMFFMITTSYSMLENYNPNIVLPVVQSAVPIDRTIEDHLTLNINKDDQLEGVKETLDRPEKLRVYLNNQWDERARSAGARFKIRRDEASILVVVRAHEDAHYGKIWEILDMCTKAGFRRWQIRGVINK